MLDVEKMKTEVDVNVAYQVLNRLCQCFTPMIPYIHAAHVEYLTPWDAICGYAEMFNLPVMAIQMMIEVAGGPTKPAEAAVQEGSRIAKKPRTDEPERAEREKKAGGEAVETLGQMLEKHWEKHPEHGNKPSGPQIKEPRRRSRSEGSSTDSEEAERLRKEHKKENKRRQELEDEREARRVAEADAFAERMKKRPRDEPAKAKPAPKKASFVPPERDPDVLRKPRSVRGMSPLRRRMRLTGRTSDVE